MKDDSISVRVDYDTKQLYLRLQREFGKTGPELIKFLLENCYSSHGLLVKLNELDNAYSMVDDTHKMVKDIFGMLDDHFNSQKKRIEDSKSNFSHGVSDSDKMKICMDSFLKTRSQHMDTFGNFKHYFDVEEAKRRVCEVNGVSLGDFNRALRLVDDGVSVEEAVSFV